jgi:hypothetical protein
MWRSSRRGPRFRPINSARRKGCKATGRYGNMPLGHTLSSCEDVAGLGPPGAVECARRTLSPYNAKSKVGTAELSSPIGLEVHKPLDSGAAISEYYWGGRIAQLGEHRPYKQQLNPLEPA